MTNMMVNSFTIIYIQNVLLMKNIETKPAINGVFNKA